MRISKGYLNLIGQYSHALIYLVTSSGPEEDVGRIGTNFTGGRTSDPVDVPHTAERATLSEP